jgi:cysteine sulfinate desulfinase/cysteine desulfurase-like protein
MGLPRERAAGAIRFSLGRGTTEEDLAYTVEVLERVTAGLRGA